MACVLQRYARAGPPVVGNAECATMNEVEIAPGIGVASAALRFAFSRSSGPGGQNVNKVSTKAELRVALVDLPPGVSWQARERLTKLAGWRLLEQGERGPELLVVSDSERSQARNRAACLQRLRELLVAAMAEPKVRRKTRPTKGSRERRLESKKRRGEIKRGRSTDGE